MTAQRYVTIALTDLLFVHLRCDGCGSALVIPIGKSKRDFPSVCPNCGDMWGSRDANGNHTMEHIKTLLWDIEKVKPKMQNAGFTLALEVSPDVSIRDA